MVERGRTKCAQYWGPEPGDQVTAGNFTITSLEVDTNPDYTITKLLLTNNKVIVNIPKTVDTFKTIRRHVTGNGGNVPD